jgi:hypothetical protein
MKCSLSHNIHEISLNFVTLTSAGGAFMDAYGRWLIDEWPACPNPTGDRKGPHHVHPTALAPTVFQVGIIFYVPL